MAEQNPDAEKQKELQQKYIAYQKSMSYLLQKPVAKSILGILT